MIRATKLGLAVAACAVLFGLPARANQILNGGFESPIVPASGITTLTAGSTDLAPWTITAGSIDVVNNTFWDPFEGSQSLDLDGNDAGTIQQVINTTAGLLYQLRFAYGNNPFAPNGTASAAVSVLGNGLLLASGVTHSGSTARAMNYLIFTGTFVANSTSTTVRFDSLTGGASGLALDAVSVEPLNAAVPEPSTFALAGLGILTLLGYRGRKLLAHGLAK